MYVFGCIGSQLQHAGCSVEAHELLVLAHGIHQASSQQPHLQCISFTNPPPERTHSRHFVSLYKGAIRTRDFCKVVNICSDTKENRCFLIEP